MDIENKITVTLTPEDIEQACKDFAGKQFDEISNPSFVEIQMPRILEPAVVIYKGYN